MRKERLCKLYRMLNAERIMKSRRLQWSKYMFKMGKQRMHKEFLSGDFFKKTHVENEEIRVQPIVFEQNILYLI
jgi:hypothetical protein